MPPPPPAGGRLAHRAARALVADALFMQLSSHRERGSGSGLAAGLGSLLDLPGAVDPSPPPVDGSDRGAVEAVEELAGVLVPKDGIEDVCRHLCRVAAGMAERPSRPGRPTPFRPYSSRDAHIMLQMKRTKEAASGSRVKALFDAGLTAGKAARDERKVPQIAPLRPYGSDGRYASAAPDGLTSCATEAATELAIEPAIRSCESRLLAMESSEAVLAFRKRVGEAMAGVGIDLDSEQGLAVRRMMHDPIMAIRDGRSLDEDQVLQDILDRTLAAD